MLRDRDVGRSLELWLGFVEYEECTGQLFVLCVQGANGDEQMGKTLVNAPRVRVCMIIYELVHGNVECRAKRRRNDNGKKVSILHIVIIGSEHNREVITTMNLSSPLRLGGFPPILHAT